MFRDKSVCQTDFRGLAFLLTVVALAQAALSAPSTSPSTRPVGPRDLLAHFGDDQFWVAQVTAARDERGDEYEQTNVSFRKRIDSWTAMPTISARVVSMASNSGELLLVLDKGQWMIADGEEIRLGSSPPNEGSVIAMGNEQDVLWALVNAPISPSTTQSATTAPVTAATQPVPQRLLVYHLDGGKWVSPISPPFEKLDAAWQVSLAVVDHSPMIAWQIGASRISISRMGADGHWSPAQIVSGDRKIVNFKLLNFEERPTLWVATNSVVASTQPGNLADAGQLYAGDNFSKVTPLKISGAPVPAGSAQTVAIAFDRLRWLAGNGEDMPFEQDFQINGEPIGNVQPVAARPVMVIPLGPPLGSAIMIMLIAGLAGGSQRKNRIAELPTGRPLKLRLAPLGIRLAAGMIDVLPLLAAMSFIPRTNSNADEFTAKILLGLALLTYIGHTMIAELLCGQTIGKMVLGLRVVDTKGQQPKLMSIIVRNLLRLIDVCLLLPIASIALTPLHQRVGDMAASTTVVVNESSMQGDAE